MKRVSPKMNSILINCTCSQEYFFFAVIVRFVIHLLYFFVMSSTNEKKNQQNNLKTRNETKWDNNKTEKNERKQYERKIFGACTHTCIPFIHSDAIP